MQAQVRALDQAVFDAVAETRTPSLDRFFVGVSRSVDHSRLWLLMAAVVALVALVDGSRGRRAAGLGVLAIGSASAVTNAALKPLAGRRRPTPSGHRAVLGSRRVRRPVSASFPSGHTASAFAFAAAMGETEPWTWLPLHAAAGAVGYARVHTGMHYPSDVAAGALIGALCGWTVRRVAARVPAGSCPRRRAPAFPWW